MTNTNFTWDGFYNTHQHKIPSQFAAFCLNEFPREHTVIDCGCGDGRDSLFFHRYGSRVIGLDASESAIKFAQTRAEQTRADDGIRFAVTDFANPTQTLQGELSQTNANYVIYSRFFLHAIPPETQRAFLAFCAAVCPSNTPALFLEFRGEKDADIPKNFGRHYRRYISHADISTALAEAGFQISYHTCGTGYAKHKDEDAYVHRIIASKNV